MPAIPCAARWGWDGYGWLWERSLSLMAFSASPAAAATFTDPWAILRGHGARGHADGVLAPRRADRHERRRCLSERARRDVRGARRGRLALGRARERRRPGDRGVVVRVRRRAGRRVRPAERARRGPAHGRPDGRGVGALGRAGRPHPPATATSTWRSTSARSSPPAGASASRRPTTARSRTAAGTTWPSRTPRTRSGRTSTARRSESRSPRASRPRPPAPSPRRASRRTPRRPTTSSPSTRARSTRRRSPPTSPPPATPARPRRPRSWRCPGPTAWRSPGRRPKAGTRATRTSPTST